MNTNEQLVRHDRQIKAIRQLIQAGMRLAIRISGKLRRPT
jgi:hypothetical protein